MQLFYTIIFVEETFDLKTYKSTRKHQLEKKNPKDHKVNDYFRLSAVIYVALIHVKLSLLLRSSQHPCELIANNYHLHFID